MSNCKDADLSELPVDVLIPFLDQDRNVNRGIVEHFQDSAIAIL